MQRNHPQKGRNPRELQTRVSPATLTVSLKKMKTNAPLQTGNRKTHKASIKNSIYSRKKSPFEQKVTGAPFAGSLLPGLVPIRDLEVRHFIPHSHGLVIHHFHRLIKTLHSEMLYFAWWFFAGLTVAFGNSGREGSRLRPSYLTNA